MTQNQIGAILGRLDEILQRITVLETSADITTPRTEKDMADFLARLTIVENDLAKRNGIRDLVNEVAPWAACVVMAVIAFTK